jgi:UDP-N-acetylglucosamine:LPS N-acetylglucosamine transferase
MLPFQKTQVYMETLNVIHDVLQTFRQKNIPVIQQKIEEEGLNVTTNVAKAFSKPNNYLLDEHLETANESILGIISMLDLSIKNSDISDNEKEEIFTKLTRLKKNLSNFQSKQKKILILSSNIGQGHMTAAKSIKEGIEYNYGYDYSVEIIDFQEVLSSFINSFTTKTYENWVKFTPSLYKFLYEKTNKKIPAKLINQLNYPFVITRLNKFFEEKRPDLLISVFPVWSYLASDIWKKKKKNAKFISVITDSITIHNSWVIADTDHFIVANKDTAESVQKLGIEKEKIQIMGFPVRLDFMKKLNKDKFLKKYELDPNKFTVLFLPTSQQSRKNIRIINDIIENNKRTNIIIITGRDSKLKPKLEKIAKKKKNIKVLGWTEEMTQFIQVSDLVISKAGGATTMECIAAGKPMIITSVIPGQEKGNAQLIKRYHLGIIADSPSSKISEHIKYIQKRYSTFEKSINRLSKPKAALEIADFIIDLIKD